MLKKVLAVFMCAVICALSFIWVYAAPSDADKATAFAVNQEKSLETNTRLLENFEKQYSETDVQKAYEQSDVWKLYPEYYGGSYIDSNGELVLMVKGEGENCSELLQIAGDDAEIQECDYSYSELCDIMSDINNAKQNALVREKAVPNPEYYDDISGSALLDDKNIIEVYIRNLNPEKEKWFKENVCGEKCVVLKSLLSEAGEDVNLSGQGISQGLSAAFRVKRTLSNGETQYGFITCAHGNSKGDKLNGYDGTYLGTVKKRKLGGHMTFHMQQCLQKITLVTQ